MSRVSEVARRAAGWSSRLGARLKNAYITAVITGRWFMVGAWLLAAATLFVAPSGGGGGGDIGDLLPPDSEAVLVLERSLEEFTVPVIAQTSVVVHQPSGLDPLTRADAALWAVMHVQASQRGVVPPGPDQIIAAVPVPTATEDTVVTYLYFSEGSSLDRIVSLAEQYAAHFRNQSDVQTFVTGAGPAQYQQGQYLQDSIGLFEFLTLLLIAGVVAVVFRSLVAPVAVLVVAGLGYLIALRLLAALAAALGFALPDQLTPLLAALLLGVVTDYCVLYFFAFRDQVRAGRGRLDGAASASLSESPIIAVAGLTVAAGTAALLSANFTLFRAFGPAMALTVLIALAVSLTLVPALMAILGGWLFFPGNLLRLESVGSAASGPAPSRLLLAITKPRGALVATGAGLLVLIVMSAPLAGLRFDLSFASGLPADDEISRAAQVLESSDIRGVTGPTEVLIEGAGLADQRPALDQLQRLIQEQPGVAAVIGPAQNPLPDTYGIVFSRDGDAARFIVIFDSDPLSGTAIDDLATLNSNLPALANQAGVEYADISSTGQTAIAAELAVITRENLYIVLFVALLVELAILALYLRALVAPVVLLVCSALSVAAALGAAVLVFQDPSGEGGLTFYVPFATAVLLLALGSDYNVFTVGTIWGRARRVPLRRAIRLAMPSTSRAVSSAGVILAASFAMVAVIPLQTFRQVAFIMTVGLLIDTFLIRPVLTPAILTLLGPFAAWPGRLRRADSVDSVGATTAEQIDPVAVQAVAVGGSSDRTDGQADGASVPDSRVSFDARQRRIDTEPEDRA